MTQQQTLAAEVTLQGIGLHTGQIVTMTLRPAAAHEGFVFCRTDLVGMPTVAADVAKVVTTNRGTTLRDGEAQVSTVEHLLSALVGVGIDNVRIDINAPEVPIMDGSALAFIKAVQSVGIVAQDAEREYFTITEPIRYLDEKTGAELLALPAEDFSITTLIDFNSPILGQQFAQLDSFEQYEADIAPCRTFVFLNEMEQLLQQGLIKGGDLDNAVVIVDSVKTQAELDDLAQKMNRQSIKIDKTGVLDLTQLRFQNEPARHKLLDVIGDLALVTKPIKGRIIATKPGHAANVAFAKLLKKSYADFKKMQLIPHYDPNAKPVMDVTQVMKKLPHRFPFLLIDKVLEISDKHIVGMKNVTMNEHFFQGHFPDNPVFPGVLQIEAMAQMGGILALSHTADEEVWDTYFLKIDNCKFRDKVLPGDTLLFRLELLEPIRRGIVHMRGVAYVGNRLAAEAELTALIQKRS